MTNKPLYTGSEWDIPLLQNIWEEIDKVGKSFGLTYPESNIEIVSYDQMIANCSTRALPSLFNHWTFGLSELQQLNEYQKTGSGLAFEVVINTDPTIAYCQENNSTTMQTLVMAHAICGHGSFFKNNFMFRDFTESSKILPYMQKYKEFLTDCEERYGFKEVEYTLDACFVFQSHAFDTAPRSELTKDSLWNMMLSRLEYNEEKDRDKVSSLPRSQQKDLAITDEDSIDILLKNDFYLPQENILALICKHSKKLKPWQKRILEGFCYMSQYFYPQSLTKIANEGWATFWHYTILKEMHSRGLLTDESILEMIDSHCAVICQPQYSTQINPYALGFAMFEDIKRMSINPTKEDRSLFPDVAGKDWLENMHWAMENYNDNSLIMQYLSPAVVKKLRLFNLEFDKNSPKWENRYDVTAVADESDLDKIREVLADNATIDAFRPKLLGQVMKRDQISNLVITTDGNLRSDKLDLALSYLWGKHYDLQIELKEEE